MHFTLSYKILVWRESWNATIINKEWPIKRLKAYFFFAIQIELFTAFNIKVQIFLQFLKPVLDRPYFISNIYILYKILHAAVNKPWLRIKTYYTFLVSWAFPLNSSSIFNLKFVLFVFCYFRNTFSIYSGEQANKPWPTTHRFHFLSVPSLPQTPLTILPP